jgi:hypothetical protein
MPKQQMVATARQPKPKSKAKARALSSTLQMRRDSATPGANGTGLRLKLRINSSRDDPRDQQRAKTLSSLQPGEDAEQRSSEAMEENENGLPISRGARRSGRVSKSTRHEDFAYSDTVFEVSSVGKTDDYYTETGFQTFPSSPGK